MALSVAQEVQRVGEELGHLSTSAEARLQETHRSYQLSISYPSLSFLSTFVVKLFVLEDEPPKICHA